MTNSGHKGASRAEYALRVALIALTLGVTASQGADPQPPALPAPQLLMFRQNADATVEVLADGTDAQAGDLVQAAYRAAGNLQGVIVSFDGDGAVTLHHPDEPDESPQLQPRGMTPLDHSFELDDARDFERFVFVSTRDHDIDVTKVLHAATRAARSGNARRQRLVLPPNWVQSSFLLRKRAR